MVGVGMEDCLGEREGERMEKEEREGKSGRGIKK